MAVPNIFTPTTIAKSAEVNENFAFVDDSINNLLLDEDNMVSNSDTKGATQQSIKAYVDNYSDLQTDTILSNFTTTSATFVDTGLEVTITITKTSDLKIIFNGLLRNDTTARWMNTRILRGASTVVKDGTFHFHHIGVSNTCTSIALENLSAGTYTYKFQISAVSGDTVVCQNTHTKFSVEVV